MQCEITIFLGLSRIVNKLYIYVLCVCISSSTSKLIYIKHLRNKLGMTSKKKNIFKNIRITVFFKHNLRIMSKCHYIKKKKKNV